MILNASERRDRLIKILMVNGKTTVKELSERLQVSQRTILRDIDTLSLHKPICAIGGRGGGVYILDTYNVNRVYMKEYESELLKRILSDAEQSGSCSLSKSDIGLLNEIITFYSEPLYAKGKRL